MKLEAPKKRNLVAKDLLSPKYRMRVVQNKKSYKRKLKNNREKGFYEIED